MATLALGVAGAAAGAFLGGPLGASIGWNAGIIIGGALFSKSKKGPERGDLRAQASAYGVPIPILYGTKRMAGVYIWGADKVPHDHKQGGKGGPKVTTTTYTQSAAFSLPETSFIRGDGTLENNPILGIGKVWANGRLLQGEGSEGGTLPMTVYRGTEDQLPDPTMEAKEGAGNVSAHRGMAYVVFTDLDLSQFGDALPNFEFEVIASGSYGLEFYAQWPVDYDYQVNDSVYSYPSELNGVEKTAEGLVLHRYRSGNDYGAIMGTGDSNIVYYDRKVYDLKGNLLSSDPQVEANFGGSTVQQIWSSLNSDHAIAFYQVSEDCGSGPVTFNVFTWLKAGVPTFSPLALCAHGVTARSAPIEAEPVYWNGNLYAAGRYISGIGDCKLRRWPAPDGSVRQELHDAEFNADAQRTGYPAFLGYNASAGCLTVGDDGYLYWLTSWVGGPGDGTRLFRLDAELNLIKTWWSGAGANLPGAALVIVIYRGHVISYKSSGTLTLDPVFSMDALNDDGTTTFVTELPAPDFLNSDLMTNSIVTPVIYIGAGLAAFRGGILKLGSTGTTWGEIVANISRHVGYAEDDYDVSDLTDPVRGFAVTSRMPGRAAIEAGQPAYQHGAVESNFQVKFPKWKGQIVATVTADDLGAREEGTDPVDPIKITHTQEKDLPRRVEVLFSNYDMDYQDGMQPSAETRSPSGPAAISIPIVFVDAEANAIANALLYTAQIERDQFEFPLPRKLTYLEPTDVIDLNGHAVRITSKDEQGYTHINCQGVRTRVGEFISGAVTPAPIGFVPQTPPPLNRTDLILLDIPLISDTDFPNGFYAAIAGRLAESWPGASLLKSIDGGVNYESIYATVQRDTFGVATTALADWTGGNVFDESHTVTVRLTPGSGELASSNQLGVLNGANKALLGDEVIQFKTATLVAPRTYEISGLLRYRRGTDRGGDLPTHEIDEDFILLPCHNIEGIFAELGAARLYKAVTSGGLLSSAPATTFTNNGIALKCYAPCQLGGGRNGAGDVTFNWTRRTRIGGAWIDNVDAPLSEASEAYSVAIYTDSTYATVARYINPTSPTTTYVAADQSSDSGSPQATIYWDVLQIGAYGDGYATRGVT